MDRRHFLVSSAGTLSGLTVRGQTKPNDRIRLAVIGLRGRGNSHIKAWAASKGVEIAALCDIDESILAKRTREVEALTNKKPVGHFDIRKLLEDKTIDAVSIATPNQWHTLRAVARGDHIICYFDGQKLIDAHDNTYAKGKVGLWTKADSVTYFDALSVKLLKYSER